MPIEEVTQHDEEPFVPAMRSTTREMFKAKGGVVVSNQPQIRNRKMTLESVALDAASDWHYYGGFLVCESCANARRVAAALNFVEGLSTEFLEQRPFNRLIEDKREPF